jgi:hypothetical protein
VHEIRHDNLQACAQANMKSSAAGSAAREFHEAAKRSHFHGHEQTCGGR